MFHVSLAQMSVMTEKLSGQLVHRSFRMLGVISALDYKVQKQATVWFYEAPPEREQGEARGVINAVDPSDRVTGGVVPTFYRWPSETPEAQFPIFELYLSFSPRAYEIVRRACVEALADGRYVGLTLKAECDKDSNDYKNLSYSPGVSLRVASIEVGRVRFDNSLGPYFWSRPDKWMPAATTSDATIEIGISTIRYTFGFSSQLFDATFAEGQ